MTIYCHPLGARMLTENGVARKAQRAGLRSGLHGIAGLDPRLQPPFEGINARRGQTPINKGQRRTGAGFLGRSSAVENKVLVARETSDLGI
jgi:hypothetical protein